MSILSYIFWPRPPAVGYDSAKLQALLIFCACLILVSFIIKRWRRKQQNPVMRKLSRSWATASVWFGMIGFILAVSRAEDISYVSMRFWWIVWFGIFALYIFIQIRLFKARYYKRLSIEQVDDPRDKYLPGKKRK